MRLAVALAAALAATSAPLAAQGTGRDGAEVPDRDARASLRGRVLDAATGRPLAGAEVRLESGGTVRLARADATGAYHFSGVAPGRHRLRARSMGHAARDAVVDLAAGRTAERDLALPAVALALDQVVVTASRREQRLADAPVTTELVSRSAIERTGASDLASVLVEQAGVELQGGHPSGAGVMLQGIGSERVLVLLDGQPVAGRLSGVFDVSRLPAAIVERVEIVRGPQSTLYGSEAMGGVVNVVTRTPSAGALGASASVLAGSRARRDVTLGVSGGRGALAGSADLSRRSVHNTPGVGSPDGALAARVDGAAKLRWAPDTVHHVEGAVLALDERQRWRTSTFYHFADNRQVTGRLGGSWRRGRHRLAPTLSASVFDHRSRASTETNPIAGDTGQRQVQRVYEAELLYNAPLARHALDVGVEARREEMRTERVRGLRTLTTVEPFAQLELAPAAGVSAVPGARVSWSEAWGTHVTPRLAARWRPRADGALTLRASAGAGYRAPDFKELYMFFQNQGANYSVVGNPDLRPETSRNATAGVEWARERAYVRAQVFANELRDFIETRPITGPDEAPVYRYANVDDGWTRGADVEGALAAGAWRAEASYGLLRTGDRATGRPLLGRPTHSARTTLSWALPTGLRASATAVFTGRTPVQRDDATGAVTGWRDAFLRTDARLAQRLPGGVDLAVGADNLFDARPREWAGFTGRHVYAGLSWTGRRALDR